MQTGRRRKMRKLQRSNEMIHYSQAPSVEYARYEMGMGMEQRSYGESVVGLE